MESQLRKRMQQVKELFTDCADVFEELMAVKTHLAEKIEECQIAVENIQTSLSKVDASEPKVEAQIQVHHAESASADLLNISHCQFTKIPPNISVNLSRTCVTSWRLRRSRQRLC